MIVFCTTCKNRTQHLRETLPRNLDDNPNSLFVVVDYNSQDDLIPFLREFSTDIKDGRLSVFHYEGHPIFRMAHAKNLAHRLGAMVGGDVLVNLDADNFAGSRFEEFAEERFSEERIFLWGRMIKGEMDRGINGRIAVEQDAFFKLGGYDERKFTHWGSDDKDFNLRLRASDYRAVEIDRQYLTAVKHNDAMRFKEYPHLRNRQATIEAEITSATIRHRVVNGGNVGCATVHRNFDREDIVQVKPIVNRVFGIGLSKTGTSSLNAAFELLGYQSWHWSSAHAARTIWKEMNEDQHSPTLERYDALCDLPIPILYKQLDHAYPGSKFILTLRNEETWLASIERHFSGVNRWYSNWDSDPFSHRIHKITWGRKDFEPEQFLQRYRAHNAAVLEYFRWRPESLLTLRIDKGEGWQKICSFLGRPTPQLPFPHENKSAKEKQT
jgi:hypothetical protein